MKILLVSEFFPAGKNLKFSGGVETRTFFIAKHLAKRHKVTVVTSRLEGSSKRERLLGFEIIRVGGTRNYSASSGSLIARIKFIKAAISKGKTISSDVVEGTNYVSHFIANRIGSYQKIPTVFWYPDVWVGSWFKNAGVVGIFGEILERMNLFLGANIYIAISKQTEKKLKNLVKTKITVIPCGVDRDEFKIKPAKFNAPTIICVSRLAPYKNLKTLLLAFAYLTTKVKKAKLIIVGTGPQEKSLAKLSKALKLESKVKFYSNLPRLDLLRLYKSSHLFSLPSKVEGFGIATIEAAAAGLPYVNSDIQIQREVTKSSKGGFLVNPDEPLMFAQKFQDLLTNKNLYQKKVNEAEELSKSYNWEHICRKTEAIYRSVI